MKSIVVRACAITAAVAIATGPALAANATPWDDSDVVLSNSTWEMYYSDLGISDITVPVNGTDEYTDIFDGAGYATFSFDDWSNYEAVTTTESTDVDISTDVNGDTVMLSTALNSTLTDHNLTATSEMRIYAAGGLFRHAVTYTNTGDTDVTVGLGFESDFGSYDSTASGGGVRGYQNSSDAVLALPAVEETASLEALNGAGAKWAVHGDSCDAPAAMAWGSAGATADMQLSEMDGDYWVTHADDVVIPAGSSITVVAFLSWQPDALIENDYTNNICDDALQATFGEGVTTAAAQFNELTGRLAVGLDGANVVNWTLAASTPSATPTPASLASTGVDAAALGANTLGAAALLGLGVVSVLAVRRRRA